MHPDPKQPQCKCGIHCAGSGVGAFFCLNHYPWLFWKKGFWRWGQILLHIQKENRLITAGRKQRGCQCRCKCNCLLVTKYANVRCKQIPPKTIKTPPSKIHPGFPEVHWRRHRGDLCHNGLSSAVIATINVLKTTIMFCRWDLLDWEGSNAEPGLPRLCVKTCR